MKLTEARIAVVDTETTGVDYAGGDRVVEFAACRVALTSTSPHFPAPHFSAFYSSLVDPARPIPASASAIHHLTDEDIQEAVAEGKALSLDALHMLTGRLQADVIVAHKAEFDRTFLPGLADRKWLCTHRMALHLMPDAEGFSNQCLRYLLGGAKLDLDGLSPHRALADVRVTAFVFSRLVQRYLDVGGADDLDALIAYVAAPALLRKIWFGKHRGTAFSELPKDYLQWALSPKGVTDADADLRYTLTYHLNNQPPKGKN